MLRNYLKSALRNLFRNRIQSSLNLLGLAIGLAACLLIFQYVIFERSYNRFHEKHEDIYRVTYSKTKNGELSFHTVLTYSGVGPLMKQEFPEVVDFVRLRPSLVTTATSVVSRGDQTFEEPNVFFTDNSFFSVFSFKMLQGNPENALAEQRTVVISESAAKKYFGEEDPIGQTLSWAGMDNFIVTGVLEDAPVNSHFQYSLLISHNTLDLIQGARWQSNDLNVFHGHLYLQTRPGTDPEALKAKFPKFVDDFIEGKVLAQNNVQLDFHLMPLDDIHLHSHVQHEAQPNGDASTVAQLSLVALLILLIAWVNYTNLSTARAMKRANEVGVRKVVGARRSQLISQFMLEAALTNAGAVMLAWVLVSAAQPMFAELGAAHFSEIELWASPWYWMMSAGLWLTGTLLSGLYPAFVLSSFRPISVLKGKVMRGGRGVTFRKVLVVTQFAISAGLIISTFTVFQQIGFMRHSDLGADIEHTLVLKGPRLVDSTYAKKVSVLRDALESHASVKSMSASQVVPGREYHSATWFDRIGHTELGSQFCYQNFVDINFLGDYKIELLSGRNFTENFQAARKTIIINETARKMFGFESAEDALGNRIGFQGDTLGAEVIGVVADFHQMSLREEMSPVILMYYPYVKAFYSLKLHPTEELSETIPQTIAFAEEKWNESFGGQPFNYFFLDEDFDRQYRSEQEFGRLFALFSLMAILVGCLGLFGLSAFVVEKRIKEIGIRKVLGATIPNIVMLLSKEFVILILIANAIAWPATWYLMSNWLEGFAFRIELSLWWFAASTALILGIAMLTTAFQTVKAAITNPVKALRYE